MKRSHSAPSADELFPILSDVVDHCRQIGLYFSEPISDLAQPLFERVHAGPHGVSVVADRFAEFGRPPTGHNGRQVLGMPAKGQGQRFKRPSATTPFNDVVLEFADDGLRYMRPFGQLALLPSEFAHAIVDGLRDCRPIFGHIFLRAPPANRD